MIDSLRDFGRHSHITWTAEDLRKEREAEKEIQMREIKYRQAITDKDGSFRWRYWGYLHVDTAGLPVFINPLGPVEWDKRPSYQFTGLKDKNGKDLDWWEGDLFETLNYTYKIIFDLGCFWFINITTNQRMLCHIVLKWDELPRKVGNIHTKPELMEQENDPKNPRQIER